MSASLALRSTLPARRDGRLVRMLRDALRPGQAPFHLLYQPFFGSRTGALLGFEALIRWRLPDGAILPPTSFIPLAEAEGLILDLDCWVLREACRTAKTWPEALMLAVNMSAASFATPDIVARVSAILTETGFDPKRLKLELTETVMLRQPKEVRAKTGALRALGVKVALDDFGSGHASLAYLRDYVFDEIKIDRAFIEELGESARSRAVLRAIIQLGAALGVTTLAEGVETEAQLAHLRARSVDAVQGYLLGRPLSQPEAEALMRDASGGQRALPSALPPGLAALDPHQ